MKSAKKNARTFPWRAAKEVEGSRRNFRQSPPSHDLTVIPDIFLSLGDLPFLDKWPFLERETVRWKREKEKEECNRR